MASLLGPWAWRAAMTGVRNNGTSFARQQKSTLEAKADRLTCTFCGLTCSGVAALNFHLSQSHSRKLSQILRENPVQTYTAIFGSHYKSLTQEKIRYPDGLVVTLSGSFRGCWYSFTRGQGGGPLRAIAFRHEEMNFAETMSRALKISGLAAPELDKLSDGTSPDSHSDDERYLQSEMAQARINTARSIWLASTPMNGSPAQTYLVEHRGIPADTLDRLLFRYLAPGASFHEYVDSETYELGTNGLPALVVLVQNGAGAVSGVQRVFLNPKTHAKHQGVAKSKLSKGRLQNCAALIQKGQYGGVLILAEGPETAASLAAAFPAHTVLASLSLGNIKGSSDVINAFDPSEVVVAGDLDDNLQTQALLVAHVKYLKDRISVPVRLVFPHFADRKQGDWNDVLQEQGLQAIQSQISTNEGS